MTERTETRDRRSAPESIRRISEALATAGIVAAVAGCSQVAALAPVGGDRLAEVRFAMIDVLLEKGVAVGEAPVCSDGDGDAITCAGTTSEGEPIDGESSTAKDPTLTVRVAGDEIFVGALCDVLDAAARP